MGQYKILPSQVLIVPGYTNEEILAMSAKTKDSSASAIKNATSSTDKTTKKEDDTKKNTNKSTSLNKLAEQGRKVASQIGSKKSSTTKSTSKTKTTKKTSKASKKKKTTSKTTKSKAGSSQKNSKSSSKNKVNESSAAVATESQVKVEKPKALLFSPESVDYTPHRKDYEEFNSADGLILIEKACDQFAELQLSLSVHQAMRIQENGTIELSSDDKRPIDIITEGAPTALDPDTELGHFMDPADFTDSFIEIRRSFFDKYMGRPLTLVSDLFPTIAVCYITDIQYNINEGEEHAEYSITFREVDNTWN